MAANYWDSTQAKYWTFTKAELAEERASLRQHNEQLHTKYVLPDRRLIDIYMQQNLIKLARRMTVRQQALATAQVYIKRFYLRVEIRKTNPFLIMATAVYLACKMEESPQHIRLMLGEAARQWPELGVTESSKIGSTFAHNIINDSYNTDLCLLYPPHILAITSIFLAVVLRPAGQPSGLQNYASSSSPTSASPLSSPSGHGMSTPPGGHTGTPAMSAVAAQQALLGGMSGLKQAGPKLGKLVDWLVESKVDMGAVVDATQELVSLYEVWEQYSERNCKEAVMKFMQGVTK